MTPLLMPLAMSMTGVVGVSLIRILEMGMRNSMLAYYSFRVLNIHTNIFSLFKIK